MWYSHGRSYVCVCMCVCVSLSLSLSKTNLQAIQGQVETKVGERDKGEVGILHHGLEGAEGVGVFDGGIFVPFFCCVCVCVCVSECEYV
jgi:hypothetical protein